MGLFRIFSGKSPEEHEERGDRLSADGAHGDARLEYENALNKIQKKYPEKAHLENRIREKFYTASEHLARDHMENADALVEIGDSEEARQLYILALDLTGDDSLKKLLEEKLRESGDRNEDVVSRAAPPGSEAAERANEVRRTDALSGDDGEDEVFAVLRHALPESIAEAYAGYGESFKKGYVALNRGDFQFAAEQLSLALEENEGEKNFIFLELATAYMHLEEDQKARDLLESFIDEFPDEMRAYELLCEIYWEYNEHKAAWNLLNGAPQELQNSRAMLLLMGENYFQENAFMEAETCFRRYITRHGKDEVVSRALAKTLEARGDFDSAREMYAEIINQCASCRTRVDPFLKRRYAELCFESGQLTSKLLEIYLSLAQEDPENRSVYFRRIAKIYEHRGETSEASRYEAFASGN